MVLRIRLARFGNKHKPFYNIVVAQARSARGAKPLEVIGTYNPLPIARHGIPDHLAPPRPFKDITLDKARARYWLGVGAQASDPVWKLLNMARLLEEKPKTYQKA